MAPRMNRVRLALTPSVGAIVLAVMTHGAAQAQLTSAQQSAMKSNCRSDFMSKCSGVSPGGKEALACLQKNVASLSPGCQTAVRSTLPPPAPAAVAPPAPAAAAPPPAAAAPASAPPPKQATIKSAPPPPATLRGATPKPKTAPPPPKQAAVPPPAAPAPAVEAPPAPTPAQMNAIKVTCRGDFKRNCRGVPLGGAEAVACLQSKAAKLSPDCKTSLAALGDAVPAPAAAAPPVTQAPNAPVVMTAVIGRACLRDLALHCRKTGIGDGQKIACLVARGPKLSVVCKAALKITDPVR